MKKMKVSLATTALALAAALSCGGALAQSYPARPVTIIAPSGPGGGFDYVGRIIAAGLTKQLGATFVLENRAGSGTLIGTQAVVNAAPDGYTLLVGGLSNLVFNTALYKSLPYKPLTEFVNLGLVASYPYMLVARTELPQNTYPELLAAIRKDPGRVTIATVGVGSGQQVLAEAFMKATHVSLTVVPYKSAQAAYADLLSGRVDLFIDTLPSVRGQLDAKRMKGFFSTGSKRSPVMPAVPTALELGMPTLEASSWFGLAGPRKMPAEAAGKLKAAMADLVRSPELKATFESGGIELVTQDVAATDAFILAENEKWSRIIKEAGIAAD